MTPKHSVSLANKISDMSQSRKQKGFPVHTTQTDNHRSLEPIGENIISRGE